MSLTQLFPVIPWYLYLVFPIETLAWFIACPPTTVLIFLIQTFVARLYWKGINVLSRFQKKTKTPKVVSVECVGLWKHRLSQSRSHGFLVSCGRTRHERRAFARSLGARTIALRAHCRATRSKARHASKSNGSIMAFYLNLEKLGKPERCVFRHLLRKLNL